MGKCGPNKHRSKRRLYFNTVKKDNSQELKARIKQLKVEKERIIWILKRLNSYEIFPTYKEEQESKKLWKELKTLESEDTKYT